MAKDKPTHKQVATAMAKRAVQEAAAGSGKYASNINKNSKNPRNS